MVDNADVPNIGNEDLFTFSNRPAFSPNYTNPDGGDTFDSLVNCINGLWGRTVRDHLTQINEAFACRHVTPLLLKVQAMVGGELTRPSDDKAYAIQSGDFAAASVQQPEFFWHLNGKNTNIGGGVAHRIIQDDQSGGRAYSYVSAHGRPGTGLGNDVIGMRTFTGAGGFGDPYNSALSLSTNICASVTVRVCEWPQANNRIVLCAIKHREILDETGASDRTNFEFGLGPGKSPAPGNDDRAYSLYLRWINGDNIEELHICQVDDELETAHGVGVTPGYEWTLGFHRRDTGGGTVTDFYVNGQLKFTDTEIISGGISPGNSPGIRFLVGAGTLGRQYVGGPIRNVMLHTTFLDESVVAPLMQFIYQKGAGFI